MHIGPGNHDGGRPENSGPWRVRCGRAVALVSGLLLLACQRSGSGPTEFPVEKPPAVSAAARALGQRLYSERCEKCHGARGGGDGPLAPTTQPRPQRLSDRVWQANASNARLRRVLVYGGGAVNKSPMMPANPDLAAQPEAVDGLITIIREMAAP